MNPLNIKHPFRALSLTTIALASAAAPGLAVPLRASPSAISLEAPQSIQMQRRPTSRPPAGPSRLTVGCGPDQVMSSWEKPIYDDQGLFVVGWETVSTCIPKDLEPAG